MMRTDDGSQPPRGIEVLVKKAAVDAEFRALLLEKRAEAAEALGLELTAAERLMIETTPREQIEAIIDGTTVPEDQKPMFSSSWSGPVLLTIIVAAGAVLVLSTMGGEPTGGTFGERPDVPLEPNAPVQVDPAEDTPAEPTPPPITDGIRPDMPITKGIRPK